MTPANETKMDSVRRMTAELVKGHDKMDSMTVALRLIDIQRKVLAVLEDVTFRPDVNEGSRQSEQGEGSK